MQISHSRDLLLKTSLCLKFQKWKCKCGLSSYILSYSPLPLNHPHVFSRQACTFCYLLSWQHQMIFKLPNFQNLQDERNIIVKVISIILCAWARTEKRKRATNRQKETRACVYTHICVWVCAHISPYPPLWRCVVLDWHSNTIHS